MLDASGDLSMVQSARCMDTAAGTDADCTEQAGLWNYAKNFTYNPAGAVTSMQLGNGRWESTQFNSRLQPTQIGLGVTPNATNLLKLDYSYGTTANNGNVLSQTITVPSVTIGGTTHNGFTAVQNYTYDSLNRLDDAAEYIDGSPNPSWRQDFTFDRYGNRRFVEGNTTFEGFEKLCASGTELCAELRKVMNPSANASDNRLSSSDGYVFDTAGNTVRDPQSRRFTYDGENKQVMVETLDLNGNPVSTVGEYEYDGDGKRVKKHVPSTGEVTVFVYDAGGKLIGEYSTVAETESPKVSYTTADHLGSPRILTDQNGTTISRRDFMPYGEEIARTAYDSDTIRKQFTGYERDDETNLDFAQARYFANGYGRFSTPDNFLNATRAENPATWNLYVYVLNNPLRYIDPTGEIERDADGNVIFHKTGEETITYQRRKPLIGSDGKQVRINGKKAYYTISYKAEVGYVKGDDKKTEIRASRALEPATVTIVGGNGRPLEGDNSDLQAFLQQGLDNSTDCHGVSFASGQVWIDNSEVPKLLKADGYRQVTGNEEVQAGDVVIYTTDGTPNGTVHSATLNQDRSTVTSKGGLEPLKPSVSYGPGPGTAWNPKRNESVKLTVWTQRPKPKN